MQKGYKKICIFAVMLFLLFATACEGRTLKGLGEKIVKKNVYLEDENVGGLSREEIEDRVKKYREKIDYQPKNAAMDENMWEIKNKEDFGQKVNIQKTVDRLLEAEEGARVELVIEKVKPEVTKQELTESIKLIGSFSTPLLDKSEERLNNIKVASEKLDYLIINPGEEFSFNNTLGKRTMEKGYELAPIIVKGEKGPQKGYGVGGGICQVSSTLYNAVDKAGLEVVERHTHSKKVGYIEKGKDATVSYGSTDFKFRNRHTHPVMIKVNVHGDSLEVNIYEKIV